MSDAPTRDYAAMALELAGLLASGATHQDRLHETKAAAMDTGEMKFCPGCRMIMLSRWLKEEMEERSRAEGVAARDRRRR